jgi:cytidine deaminase
MIDQRRAKLLLRAARRATEHAYAPYSRTFVGAAVLTSDGRRFTGSNLENQSYGLTVCAERCAVFKAVSEGARRIVALAVTVDPDTSTIPFPPCGACLQVLTEFMPRNGLVIVDRLGTFKLSDLVPVPFKPKPGKS